VSDDARSHIVLLYSFCPFWVEFWWFCKCLRLQRTYFKCPRIGEIMPQFISIGARFWTSFGSFWFIRNRATILGAYGLDLDFNDHIVPRSITIGAWFLSIINFSIKARFVSKGKIQIFGVLLSIESTKELKNITGSQTNS